MSKNNDKGAADKGTNTKAAAPKLRTGYEWPEKLLIVELDNLKDDPRFASEEGQRLCAELADPERAEPPTKDAVNNLINHGYDKPIAIVEYSVPGTKEKLKIVGDGRQRIMSGRLANAELPPENRMQAPYYVAEKGMTALDVARANEWARKDSPLAKARRAARLMAPPLNYSSADVIKQFSTDGVKAISKMTLTNWKRLLNCIPEIQAKIESGDCPVAIGYEIGKLPPEKQADALAKIEADGGTLKGTRGRQNARDAGEDAEDGDESGDESSDVGESSGGGGGTRTRSTKMTAAQIKKAAEIFTETPEEPFEDDAQALTGALLACVIGDDPTGKGLRRWPSVHKHMRKVLRSEKRTEENKDGAK